MINPFAARGSGDEYQDGIETGSLGIPRSISLRAITMRDFDVAVRKLKESRMHCGDLILNRQRIDLD